MSFDPCSSRGELGPLSTDFIFVSITVITSVNSPRVFESFTFNGVPVISTSSSSSFSCHFCIGDGSESSRLKLFISNLHVAHGTVENTLLKFFTACQGR